MSIDKQIEEMTVEFAKINCNPKGCYSCDLCDEYGSLKLNCEDYLRYRTMSETFYNAGYRKAPEVAREIVEEIIEALTAERIEEDRKANSALEAQDTASYEVYNYAEDKLGTLVTALSIYKKKYAEEGK